MDNLRRGETPVPAQGKVRSHRSPIGIDRSFRRQVAVMAQHEIRFGAVRRHRQAQPVVNRTIGEPRHARHRRLAQRRDAVGVALLIGGVVVDEAGKPLAGVTVVVSDAQGTRVASVATKADGTFASPDEIVVKRKAE